jgi:hypothetical protein
MPVEPHSEIKNRPENKSRSTTSPLVVRNPFDWPVGREVEDGLTRLLLDLRKGERGVVRGNPLALWRGAAPNVLKRLSPVGWLLIKVIPVSLFAVHSSSILFHCFT